MPPLLELLDLNVHYGGIHALKGVSMHVDEGEVVTLIGANGAGKTTTLRGISGLVKPSGGVVKFDGQIIADSRDHKEASLGRSLSGLIGGVIARLLDTRGPHTIVKRGLIHAPEGRGIFANMTVEENLEMGAFLRRDKAAVARDKEHALGLFPRLKERLAQNAGTLSGGELQMLSIARALLSRPRLLLLDEPSLGLAPQVVALIFKIVRTIAAEGTTILLVEQNAHMALKVAQRAYVLETGKIVLEGPAAQLSRDDKIRKAYLGIHD